MAPFSAKFLVLMQLSMLLLTSSVLAVEPELVSLPALPPAEAPKHHKGGHHHHPPTYPPVKPPMQPPVKPPVKAPVHPPVKPPTKAPVHPPVPAIGKPIAVRGVVYCKPCSALGFNFQQAKPLQGAVVTMRCNNTRYKPAVANATTDKNGYFQILPMNVTSNAYHKCLVYLVKSPNKNCTSITNLNSGLDGAKLNPNPVSNPHPFGPKYAVYNVGPFAFEPAEKIECPR